jgi:hypothetical protein
MLDSTVFRSRFHEISDADFDKSPITNILSCAPEWTDLSNAVFARLVIFNKTEHASRHRFYPVLTPQARREGSAIIPKLKTGR